MQTPRIIMALSHLRALHDALRETFLKVTKITDFKYRKIPKISSGAYSFQRPYLKGLFFKGAYIQRGLSTEENLRFKIDWAILLVGKKFTFFAFCI